MPIFTTWEPPELFVELDGEHRIFHAYKDGYADRRLEMWYTTVDDDEEADYQFDIRDLPEFKGAADKGDHKAILRAAYANGHLTFKGEDSGRQQG